MTSQDQSHVTESNQFRDLPATMGPMANSGPWLTSLGSGCTVLVEMDARRTMPMKGKQGTLHGLPTANIDSSSS